MVKKFLLFAPLFLVACAGEPVSQAPYALFIPKQIIYNNQQLDLITAQRTNPAYSDFSYADEEGVQQLRYMLSSTIIPQQKLKALLLGGADEKNIPAEYQVVDDKLYIQTEQKVNDRIYYRNSVSRDFACGTLTVIINSETKSKLVNTELADSLQQIQCKENPVSEDK